MQGAEVSLARGPVLPFVAALPLWRLSSKIIPAQPSLPPTDAP